MFQEHSWRMINPEGTAGDLVARDRSRGRAASVQVATLDDSIN
jgi:hypothetical protein